MRRRPAQIETLLLLACLAPGCGVIQPSPCVKQAQRICESCDQTPYNRDIACGCVNGELDNPTWYFETTKEAEKWCFEYKTMLEIPDEYDETYCKQTVEYIDAYPEEFCDDWGLNTFICYASYDETIANSQVCNGIEDCEYGEDEEYCTSG